MESSWGTSPKSWQQFSVYLQKFISQEQPSRAKGKMKRYYDSCISLSANDISIGFIPESCSHCGLGNTKVCCVSFTGLHKLTTRLYRYIYLCNYIMFAYLGPDIKVMHKYRQGHSPIIRKTRIYNFGYGRLANWPGQTGCTMINIHEVAMELTIYSQLLTFHSANVVREMVVIGHLL